jgi:hypothetical protein
MAYQIKLLCLVQIILISVNLNVGSHSDENPCNYEVENCKCIHSSNNFILTCSDFTSFDKLNFKTTNIKFHEIILKPKNELALDATLDFKGLMLLESAVLRLYNIASFSLDSNAFGTLKIKGARQYDDQIYSNDTNKRSSLSNKFNTLHISNSKFNFIFKNTNIKELKTCDGLTNQTFPDSLFSLTSNIVLENVDFQESICPIYFHNINLKNLTIIGARKRIRFPPIKSQLNCFIEGVHLVQTELGSIDQLSFFIDEVFRHTSIIEIDNSKLEFIAADTFKYLSSLKTLKFVSLSSTNLVKSKNNWLSSLNGNKTANLTDPSDVTSKMTNRDYFKLILIDQQYKFPDEDFCVYEKFPFEKLIFILFDKLEPSECTCTLSWLLQYAHLTKTVSDPDFDVYRNKCEKLDEIRNCDFYNMIRICNGEEPEYTSSSTSPSTLTESTILLNSSKFFSETQSSTESTIFEINGLVRSTSGKNSITHTTASTDSINSTHDDLQNKSTTNSSSFASTGYIYLIVAIVFFIVLVGILAAVIFIKSKRLRRFTTRFRRDENLTFENEACDEISLGSL